MKSFKFISAILKGTWFIDPQYVTQHLPVLVSILKGEHVDNTDEPTKSRIVAEGYEEGVEVDSFTEVEDECVSLISLIGPIMKYDSWCEVGTKSKAAQLLEADSNHNIKGHILYLDTPGGETLACEIMVAAIRSCTKPVTAVVEGMDCSAGLWISSACDRTYVSGQTSMVGCVGTMTEILDFTEALKKEGIALHSIISDQTPEKNKPYYEALKGNYTPMKQGTLNPLSDIFISQIRAGRPNVKPEALTGATYLATEAIAMGLADEFGNISTAINFIMFNQEYRKLNQFKGKQLTPAQAAEVTRILAAAGINIEPKASGASTGKKDEKPVATLYEASGEPEDQDIYVYSNEGEDPTGKRCVYSDATGQPTETNVADGDHTIADGSKMTTSTHDDGMSYVDAFTAAAASAPATAPPAPAAPAGAKKKVSKKAEEPKTIGSMKVEELTDLIASTMDEKLEDFKSTIVLGKSAPKAINGSVTREQVRRESPFEAKKKEILKNYKSR